MLAVKTTTTHIEVQINSQWVSFSIFEQGKYAGEIAEYVEDLESHPDPNEQLMVFAEALSTSVRFLDHLSGIYYHVDFQKGSRTTVSVFTFNDHFVKEIVTGALIAKDWKGSLEHVLDI